MLTSDSSEFRLQTLDLLQLFSEIQSSKFPRGATTKRWRATQTGKRLRIESMDILVHISPVAVSRLLPLRLSPCISRFRWQSTASASVTGESVQEAAEIAKDSSEPNMLATSDEDAPPVHITVIGEVYDAVRIARDVSRMYPHVRQRMNDVNKPPPVLFEFQKEKQYLRKTYARYGRESGVDPGVMWPSKEEIQQMIKHDRDLGVPTLQESWVRVLEKRKTELEQRRARYEKVTKNMAKMDAEIKAFHDRRRKANEALEAEKEKREKLMEEAKELLGFHVDPRDKRFQELLEAKEKEQKKVQKTQKKKEKEARLVARLTSVDEPSSESS